MVKLRARVCTYRTPFSRHISPRSPFRRSMSPIIDALSHLRRYMTRRHSRNVVKAASSRCHFGFESQLEPLLNVVFFNVVTKRQTRHPRITALMRHPKSFLMLGHIINSILTHVMSCCHRNESTVPSVGCFSSWWTMVLMPPG